MQVAVINQPVELGAGPQASCPYLTLFDHTMTKKSPQIEESLNAIRKDIQSRLTKVLPQNFSFAIK